jgi:hypothetical protein
MTPQSVPDADELEAHLLGPAPTSYNLLASFCLPRAERRAHLDHAASWIALDRALRIVEPEANIRGSIEDRWLNLLELCVPDLASPAEQRQLTAMIRALRTLAKLADSDPDRATMDTLWSTVSRELEDTPSAQSSATLRGRKWNTLRHHLAGALAFVVAKASPSNLLPRTPREPLMFGRESLDKIWDALRDPSGSGLVVIDAKMGSGRSELALAYAHEKSRDGTYERVFVLRATDQARLEQDYMELAAIVAGDSKDRGLQRRRALEYLEENDRWLIVLQSVIDPAILQGVLPWRQRGHILCTFAEPTAPARGKRDDWLEYFNVDPKPLSEFAPEFDARTTLQAALPKAVHAEIVFEDLVRALGSSRYATVLALAWFKYTQPQIPRHDPDMAALQQVRGYVNRWRDVSRQHAASLTPEVQAAYVQLMELHEGTRWREPDDVVNVKLERDALQLLGRLAPFVERKLPAATFQTALLDHDEYPVPDRIDDSRLVLLADLGLADRHDRSRVRKYFHINSAVLKAVGLFDGLKDDRGSAQANAARTLVKVLSRTPVNRGVPDLTFELLPHMKTLAVSEREARRNSDERIARPLLVAELCAYSALCYFARNRPRDAQQQLAAVREIFELPEVKVPSTPIDGLEDWTGLTEDERPELVTKRMGKLVKALRVAGFPQAAKELFELLESVAGREVPVLDDRTEQQIARLRFEAALAYHDLDEPAAAEHQLKLATDLWRLRGNRICQAMAKSLTAELAYDRGDHSLARELAEEAKTTRLELLGDPDHDKAAAIADLARSNYLLGRIAYAEGRLDEARKLLAESVDGWDSAIETATAQTNDERPRFSRLSQISTRSYLALMHARLGDIDRALEEADAVRHELRDTPHRSHAAAVIGSNIAQAYRLSGKVGEAAAAHREAAIEAERAWAGIAHRSAQLVRRKHADSLLDVGEPGEALDVLMDLLRKPLPHASPVARQLAHARALTSVGRLLLENSLWISPLKPQEQDRVFLQLSESVLKDARALFEDAAKDQALNPGMLACLLELTEIAIRRRDGATAEALADEALELATVLYRGKTPQAAARARRIRARAIDGGEIPQVLEELEGDLEELCASDVIKPLDRFEIALARVELLACRWLLDSDQNNATTVLGQAKTWLEDVLEQFASISVSQPYQLSARMYAELAALAERVGLPSQQRGRLLREADRHRPRLVDDPTRLVYEIGRLPILLPA